VAKLLAEDKYDRFGGMPQADWDRTFINRDDKNNPTWRWPPTVSGFNPKWGPPYGTPNEKKRMLTTGTPLDRFGSEYGAFIAPAGASFAARALPPSSLNTLAAQTQSGYHLYCVAKPFEVDAGPIYPWFGQRGKATQFYLNKAYIPSMSCPEKPPPDDQCVKWLLANGYLNEIIPT
jgi:Tuberculosis necrotizing toxin